MLIKKVPASTHPLAQVVRCIMLASVMRRAASVCSGAFRPAVNPACELGTASHATES